MKDARTLAQRWADWVTEFSGSWTFIFLFAGACIVWATFGTETRFDPFPYLFLNIMLTIISTFQSPIILMSQNRQNDMDRERVVEILERLERLQFAIEDTRDRLARLS